MLFSSDIAEYQKSVLKRSRKSELGLPVRVLSLWDQPDLRQQHYLTCLHQLTRYDMIMKIYMYDVYT